LPRKRERIEREKKKRKRERGKGVGKKFYVHLRKREWRVEARSQVLGQEKENGTWSYRYSDAGGEQVKTERKKDRRNVATTLEYYRKQHFPLSTRAHALR
jgi:hypothetical protein